ncbi:MAG: hypothetical protein CSA24_00965 [Deltaproteobacteria bacterium]|nr:MAG: hypothetical protein CSA24_00965 [Deltaproteobacteria bacterium]
MIRRLALILLLSTPVAACAACAGTQEGNGDPDTSIHADVGDSSLATDTDGDLADGRDTSGQDDVDTGPTEPTLVELVSPADGIPVGESVLVEAVPVGRDELAVDYVYIKVNGLLVRADTKLPTSFLLDTREHQGPQLTVTVEATAGFESGADEVSFYANTPPIVFEEVTPQDRAVQNGQVVSVIVGIDGPPELELTADFSALDDNYEPGMETAYPIGGGKYAFSYVVSTTNSRRDGNKHIPITAKAVNWEVTYDQLIVRLQNQPENPIAVTGGIFVDSYLPQPSQSWSAVAPTLESSNDFIITGGSVPISVDFSSYEFPSEVVGLVIGLEGYDGYFHVPLSDSTGVEELSIFLRAYASYETPPSMLPVRVAARDVSGNISNYGVHLFSVTPVGTGDIQVSLSWDTATDVDLHVIDPFGCEIYYGNKTCSSGGELDLDSNAGCGIDGVNNENVFWPDGGAPGGTYTVKVDFWSDCDNTGANYFVTLNYCGRTEVHEGRFAPGTSDNGSSGSGVLVTTFSNTVCQTQIRGRVRYEDRTFDETGFGAYSWRPVRNAVVELRRLSDGQVLGTATTNQTGDYELGFANDGEDGLVVAVLAKTNADEGLRDIKVLDHPKFKKLYEVNSTPIVPRLGQEVVIQDIDISVELNAGAYNVFDVLQRGYDLVRRMTGAELGELIGFWKTGSDTTDTLFCSQYLYDSGTCTDLGSVSVQGKDTDRDEYDDMVILKEFFRFALWRVSRDDHPGGGVDGTRDEPNRAWSEGVTSFFANDVLETRYFVNSQRFGVYLVDDVETFTTPWAFETSDEALTGDLSPFLVHALLWDLADGPGVASDAELFDAVGRSQAAIYDVLFNYLPSERYVDRGAPGVDLTDFLDGWFCRGWGQTDEVETLLLQRGYPYDFEGPTGCEHTTVTQTPPDDNTTDDNTTDDNTTDPESN